MKATEQYFPVVLITVLYKVGLPKIRTPEIIRNPESGIQNPEWKKKKEKEKIVNMKILTKVKVTWETVFQVFIAFEKL